MEASLLVEGLSPPVASRTMPRTGLSPGVPEDDASLSPGVLEDDASLSPGVPQDDAIGGAREELVSAGPRGEVEDGGAVALERAQELAVVDVVAADARVGEGDEELPPVAPRELRGWGARGEGRGGKREEEGPERRSEGRREEQRLERRREEGNTRPWC